MRGKTSYQNMNFLEPLRITLLAYYENWKSETKHMQ
jgi:hypothetical protein